MAKSLIDCKQSVHEDLLDRTRTEPDQEWLWTCLTHNLGIPSRGWVDHYELY